MQSSIISQPVKSLIKLSSRPWTVPYNNVWATAMFCLAYNISIDHSKSIWYAIEQYGERQSKTLAHAFAMGLQHTQHIANYRVTESNFTYFCLLLWITCVAILSNNFVDGIYYVVNLNGFSQIKILMHYPFNDLQCQIYSLCRINSYQSCTSQRLCSYWKWTVEVPKYF